MTLNQKNQADTQKNAACEAEKFPKEVLQNPISERWGKQICLN